MQILFCAFVLHEHISCSCMHTYICTAYSTGNGVFICWIGGQTHSLWATTMVWASGNSIFKHWHALHYKHTDVHLSMVLNLPDCDYVKVACMKPCHQHSQLIGFWTTIGEIYYLSRIEQTQKHCVNMVNDLGDHRIEQLNLERIW